MAPSITTIDHYTHTGTSIPLTPILEDKVSHLVPGEVVSLPLALNTSHIVEVVHSQYRRHLDERLALAINIETVFNICWSLVINCFSPSRVIYLELHPSSNSCYISDTFKPNSESYSLEFTADRLLKDLVRDFCRVKAGLSFALPGDSLPPDSQGRFLSSAIRYTDDQFHFHEAPHVVNSTITRPKLWLNITGDHGSLRASLTFSNSSISKDLAMSLLHCFNKVVNSIHKSPLTALQDLDLYSDLDLLLAQRFAKDVSPFNEVLLHEMALDFAQHHPETPAVCSWDGNLSYGELDDLTSRLGKYLLSIGVGPEIFVLSCFEKSMWAIVARLAIMKAGGAYISINASDPPVFLKSVVDRARVNIMLTSPAYVSSYASLVETIIPVAWNVKTLPKATGTICPTVKPRNACLILFTSGSTGQPKGIIQEHRSYATAIRDYNRVLGLARHSRVLQFDDYAFDISNNDYLTALAAGGCCCVPTPEKTIPALIKNINTLRANMTFLTPTVAIQIDPRDVPSLDLVCIGGESMSNDLLLKWTPHVKLVNQYGMSEAATFCAYNDAPEPGRNAVVGKAGSGAIWIANPASPERPVPIGSIGEILIEGPNLSRGYLDDLCQKPDVGFLSAVPRWIANLYPSRATNSRIYRSGDLGRYLHNGTVEHMGRKDTLLKLNGERVEATEVEHVLRKSISTDDCVVVDILGEINGVQDPVLVAFLYLAHAPTNIFSNSPDSAITISPITQHVSLYQLVEEMQNGVKSTLPKHMMPHLFLLVNRIPRTKSNKLDRRKLRQVAQKWYMTIWT